MCSSDLVCIKNPAARRLDPALPLVQIIRLLGIIDGPEHTQIHQPPGKSDHHSHAEYPQKNRLFPVIRFVFTHPYKGQSPCVGYCLKQVQKKKETEPER